MAYLLLLVIEEVKKFVEKTKQNVENFDATEYEYQYYKENKWKHISHQWIDLMTDLRKSCIVSYTHWGLYSKIVSIFDHDEHDGLTYMKGYNTLINDFASLTRKIQDEISYFPGPYTFANLKEFEEIVTDALCEFWKARKLMLWKRDNPHGNTALKMIDLEYQFYGVFN